jgi:hypothetical protein
MKQEISGFSDGGKSFTYENVLSDRNGDIFL